MTVQVYSRSTCAPCQTLKYWLNKKGITYQELEPDETITMVPTVKIGDETIVGLDFLRLTQLLHI